MRPRLAPVLLALCAVSVTAQSVSPAVARHIQIADGAKRLGDCHTASQEYGAAARLLPGSGELRTNQGIALFCDGQLDAAVAALHTALRLNPDLPVAHLFLGLAAVRLAEPATAVSELGHYLAVAPRDPVGRLWLGYALAAQDNHREAIVQFNEVLQHDPGNLDAQYALGENYLELGRQQARALEALDPNGPLLLQLAAEQGRRLGDLARASAADAEAKRRATTAPALAPAQQAKAQALLHDILQAQERGQAILGHLLETAPDSARAHQIQADTLLLQQQIDPALEQYRIVARLNPSLPGIHLAIGNCLMLGGHFDQALAELQTERTLQPASAEVLTALGRAQFALGDNAAAQTSLEQALTRHDPPAEAHLLLARTDLREARAAAAVPELELYLAADPASSSAWYLLARAYRSAGQTEKSAEAFATSRRLVQAADARQLTETVTRAPGSLGAASLPVAEADDSTVAGKPPLVRP